MVRQVCLRRQGVQHGRDGVVILWHNQLIGVDHGNVLVVIHVLVETVVLSNLFVSNMTVKVCGEEQILVGLVIGLIT